MNLRPLLTAGFGSLLVAAQLGCSSDFLDTLRTPATPEAGPEIHLHFLGHAAFILLFEGGPSVLSDYGDPSQTGWPVRVYDIGDFHPDIVTYSQTRDRAHSMGMDFPGAIILAGNGNILEYGLRIDPVPTRGQSMDSFDNCGFLFTYGGAKILIAGEPLQYILNVFTVEVQKEIRETYPDVYDLAVVPVSGLNITFPQLELFIRLLKAKRVILMHAASESLYPAFLDFLAQEHPGRYQLDNRTDAGYDLEPSVFPKPPLVIALKPAAYPSQP